MLSKSVPVLFHISGPIKAAIAIRNPQVKKYHIIPNGVEYNKAEEVQFDAVF